MNRTLWKYLPASTDEELRELDRLRAIGPEEMEVPLGGASVPVRIELVVEAPCDGKAAVGVALSFPPAGGGPGRGAPPRAQGRAWGLCEAFLERHLRR